VNTFHSKVFQGADYGKGNSSTIRSKPGASREEYPS
jgi:hypothetical protein